MNKIIMRVINIDDSDLIRERPELMLRDYSRADLIGSFHNGKGVIDAIKVTNTNLAIPIIKCRDIADWKL
jgi:DNA-binding NarL/FixJ family response regulator